MEEIWKFTVTASARFTISMPKGTKVLSAHEQHGEIQMWAHVREKSATELDWEDREFELVGTGHEMNVGKKAGERKFITTILIRGGEYVFHLFEIVDVAV